MDPSPKSDQTSPNPFLPAVESGQARSESTPETHSEPAGISLPLSPVGGSPNPLLPGSGLNGSQPLSPPATTVSKVPLNTPPVADDLDVIEKEWVMKVKQIIARTRGDPYAQTKAINQLRADYLKKRYNKDLKLIDG